jgi:hypothetical protein
LTIRKVGGSAAGVADAKRVEQARTKTRIFARLGWGENAGTELTVPFRTVAMLGGRLVDAEGTGLGRRSLRVVSRPSRGALRRVRVDSVKTGEHGGFSLRLGPGTSRRISIAFAGDERFDPAARGPLTLRVRGGIELHARPHSLETGEALRFRGRVRSFGAPLPRRGKLVAIQYFERATRRWRPVLVTRSDHSGRFRASYRFRYIQGSASISLRAIALAEDRWPYAPGPSRPVIVRVSG